MGKSKDETKTARTLRAEPVRPGATLMFKPQVLRLVGLTSYSSLYGWMQREEDPFPSPVELGPAGGRSSLLAWHSNEVFAWLATRPRRQFGQHAFRGRGDVDTTKKVKASPIGKRS